MVVVGNKEKGTSNQIQTGTEVTVSSAAIKIWIPIG